MRGISTIAGVILTITAAPGNAAPAQYFELGSSAVLETGDTWLLNDDRYRLFGVQSCLRGTTFTNRQGREQDCGDASLAVLAAFITDTHPSCAPIAVKSSVTYVICFATVAGRRLDLGTVLISEGYAFTALDSTGLPVNPNYAVAEQQARARKSGLWQFDDVQHPSLLLGRAINDHREARQ
jgi:endonuclease YncB( thermonuclease family)